MLQYRLHSLDADVLAAYEEVRADPTMFVVAPGHELPEIEEVVRRTLTIRSSASAAKQRGSWPRTIREAERRRPEVTRGGTGHSAPHGPSALRPDLRRRVCQFLLEALERLDEEIASKPRLPSTAFANEARPEIEAARGRALRNCEHDLAELLAGLEPRVRGTDLRERHDLVDDGPRATVGDSA